MSFAISLHGLLSYETEKMFGELVCTDKCLDSFNMVVVKFV